MRRIRLFFVPFTAVALVITLLLQSSSPLIDTVYRESYNYRAQNLKRPDLISYDAAREKGHIARVPSMEDEYSFVFENMDGTFTSYSYGTKVQYVDENNNLTEIDLDFQPVVDADNEVTSYAYTNGEFDVTMPNQLGEDGQAGITNAEFNLTMTPIDEEGNALTSQPGQLEKTGDFYGAVSYDNAFGQDTSLEFSTSYSGFKEDIILDKAPGSNIFRYRVTAPGAAAKVSETGAVEFYNPITLATYGNIPEPFAMDSFTGDKIEGDGHYCDDIKVTMEEIADGQWIYSMAVNQDYLNSPNTVYPVKVDPTVTLPSIRSVTDIFDTFVSQNQDVSYYNQDKIFVGRDGTLGALRGYSKFNMDRLYDLDNVSVVSAYYVNQEFLGYTSTCYVDLYQVTSYWTSGSVRYASPPGYGAKITSQLVNGAREYVFNVTDLVKNWYWNHVQVGGYADYGFALKSDREGSVVLRKFRSSESATYIPYLSITYTTLDIDAPTTPTVTATHLVNTSYNGTARLKINWSAATDASSGINNYSVVVKNSTGATVDSVAGLSPSTLEWTTGNYLEDDKTYSVYVTAADSALNYLGNYAPHTSTGSVAKAVPDCQKPTVNSLTINPDSYTNGNVDLAWDVTEPSGLSKIEYWITGGSTTTITTPANASSTTIDTSTLATGDYTLNIKFTDTKGNLTTTTKILKIDKTNPTAVTLSAGTITSNSVDLTWTESTDDKGFAQYEIYQNGNPEPIHTTTDTTYGVTGLSDSTQYVFNIRAYDQAGNYAASNDLSVMTVDIQAPTVPTNVTAGEPSGTSISLSWTAATDNIGVNGYEIYNGEQLIGTTTGTTFTAEGLTNGTTYTFTVRALDAAGNSSADSEAITVSTLDTQSPTAPTNLTVGTLTSSTVALSWTLPSDNVGVVSYKIFKDGSATPIATSTSPSCTITGLTQLTEYHFTVVAFDAANNASPSSNEAIASTLEGTPPTTPTNLTLGLVNESQIALSWTASTDNIAVTGYNIYSGPTIIATTTDTSYTASNLANGTQYRLIVKAVDAAGNLSAASNFVIANTTDTAAPAAPASLSVSQKTASSVKLTWPAAIDNVATVRYDIFEGLNQVGSTTNTSFTIDNLNTATQYSYTVIAYDAADHASLPSNVLTVLPLESDTAQRYERLSAEIEIVGGSSFVDVQNGFLNYVTEDISLPDWQFNMAIGRNYNSQSNLATALGKGWDMSFNLYLREEYDNVDEPLLQRVIFHDQDGKFWSFTVQTVDGVTSYKTPFGSPYTLSKVNGLYQMKDSSGLLYRYNSNLKIDLIYKQQYLYETSETFTNSNNMEIERLDTVTIKGYSNWVFNAEYDQTGSMTGLTATDTTCPFTLALDSDHYVLTDKAAPYIAYSYETNAVADLDQVLQITTDASVADNQIKISFAYNADNKLETVTDGLNEQITLTYNAAGLLDTITDAHDRQLKYNYSGDNQLIKAQRLDHFTDVVNKTGPVYAETLYTYDINGYLTSVTDPDNVATQLAFDSQGRLILCSNLYSDSTDAMTQKRTMGRELTLIDYAVGSTTVRCQFQISTREETATEDTLESTTRLGKIVYTQGTGYDWITTIEVYQQPTLIAGQDGNEEADFSYALLRTQSIAYSDDDNDGWFDAVVATTADQDSATADLTDTFAMSVSSEPFYVNYKNIDTATTIYDLCGRTAIYCKYYANHTPTGHNCQQTTYSLAGRSLTKKTDTGFLTTYHYDSTGRVSRTEFPDEHVSTNSYAFVDLTTTADYFQAIEIDYGLNYFAETHLNYLGQTIYQKTKSCGDWLSLAFTYNSLGQQVTKTDKAGNVTTTLYTANGDIDQEIVDLAGVTDNQITDYEYYADGAMRQQTDSYGNTTVYTYEPYNDKRLLTKDTKVNGQMTTESYDYSIDENGCTTLTTTYPDNTQQTTKLTANGQTDSINRSISGLAGGTSISSSYEYNDQSQLSKFGHNGFEYVLTYDTDGNIATVAASDGTAANTLVLLTKTRTDNNGVIINSDAYANGQTVTQVTDQAGRLDFIQYIAAGSTTPTTLYDYSYGNNDPENIAQNGDETTTITDWASDRKAVSSTISDANSYGQTIVVTNAAGSSALYALDVINNENAITLTTKIYNNELDYTSQNYTYSKDAMYRLYQTNYELLGETTVQVQKTNTFGNFGQLGGTSLLVGGTNILTTGHTYKSIANVDFSGQIESESIQTPGDASQYNYVYDTLGNITKIQKTVGTTTTDLYRYVYDEASQLIREDNAITGKTTAWQYDVGGNIRTKTIYTLTAEGVCLTGVTPEDTITYEYSTGIWKDKLTKYGGTAIEYDLSGNPTSYLGADLTWTMGRQLESYTKDGTKYLYTYNEQGIRTSKTKIILATNESVRTDYYLNGSQVIAEVTGDTRIDYRYDGDGKLIALRYNGAEYYTVTNIQGDIIGLLDSTGTIKVQYTYDAWGNQSCNGTSADTLGEANPYGYRGYKVDRETGLYYLQSRYYDAAVGRFINADDLIIILSNQKVFTNKNVFAYCQNSPICRVDSDGYASYLRMTKSGLPILSTSVKTIDINWPIVLLRAQINKLAMIRKQVADKIALVRKKEADRLALIRKYKTKDIMWAISIASKTWTNDYIKELSSDDFFSYYTFYSSQKKLTFYDYYKYTGRSFFLFQETHVKVTVMIYYKTPLEWEKWIADKYFDGKDLDLLATSLGCAEGFPGWEYLQLAGGAATVLSEMLKYISDVERKNVADYLFNILFEGVKAGYKTIPVVHAISIDSVFGSLDARPDLAQMYYYKYLD